MKKKLYILLICIFSLTLNSCDYISAILIAKTATCKVKINEKYIKSSCDLINGIFIEKLQIIQKDSSGFPKEYFVTERCRCYNPGVEGVQKFWPDKIYFKKKNGHYRWGIDTVNIKFRRKGIFRLQIENDSISNKAYAFHTSGLSGLETCPIEFERNCWYYLYLYDQRISEIYLFVDERKDFYIFKYDSGKSPI